MAIWGGFKMPIEPEGWYMDAGPPSWDAVAKTFSFFLWDGIRPGRLETGRSDLPINNGTGAVRNPEGGKHQCHEFGVVAPYRLRAETQIRQRGRLLDPGRP